MSILEDISADLCDAIRHVKTCDPCVGFKNVPTQNGQLACFSNRNIRQLGTIVERIAVDLRNRVRNGDRRQAAVAKGTPADALQLGFLFEGHALQLAAPIEIELTDIGDILANDDLLDLTVMLADRGHTAELIIIHDTGTTNCKPTVAVEDIVDCLTAKTSVDNICRCAADKAAAVKFALLTIELISALIGKSVLIERVGAIREDQSTRDRAAADEIAILSRLRILRPAGICAFLRAGLVSADLTGEHVRLAVVVIGMLIIFAQRGLPLAILVEHGLTSVLCHIIRCNGSLEAVGGDVDIDALEVERGLFEVEVLIIHDGVGLAAGGAADVVHGALFLHLTGRQGSGAGVAVVIAGEVEVDPGCVAGCGQILLIDLAAAGGVGIVGGDVCDQHLPGAVRLRSVLDEPLCELLQGVLVGGVVQDGDVDVAALHGVPGGGNAEHAPSSDGAVAAVVCLVVADDVEYIGVADAVEREELQGVVPLVVVADIVHGVAELNAEGILPGQMIGDADHALKGGLLLNVRQQEEAGLLPSCRDGEAADGGPDRAVADAVVIRRACGEAAQRHAIHAVDLLAAGVGDQAARALDLRGFAQICAGGKLCYGGSGAVARVAHPGDGLAVCCRGEGVDDIVGCAGLVAHGVVAEQGDLIGAVALGVLGAQVHTALACRQAGDVDPAVPVGLTLQDVIGIDVDAGCRSAVAHDGHGRGGLAACHGGLGRNAVHGLDRVIRDGRGEAGRILVQVADIEALRLLAAVGALRDLHVDAAALCDGGGDGNVDRGQRTGRILRVVNGGDLHGDDALGGIVAPAARHALGEGDVRNGIAARDGDGCCQGCDGSGIIALQRQLPRFADGGNTQRVQRNVRHVRLFGFDGEVAGLAGDVAVAVLQVERDGVQAVAEVHQAGGAAENVTIVLAAIGAVKVEIGGFHAGGVGIGLLTIVIGDEKAELVGVEGHAVLELRFGAVVVDELDGGHDRSRDVLIVCAVDDAEIIEKNVALQVALVELDAVGGVPADAAGCDHRTEQHAAVGADQGTCILGQISLKILPAGLQPLAAPGAAIAEIDIGVRPALAIICTGGDLGTQPRDRDSLGNIDPDAKRCRRAVNGEIVAQTQAGTVGCVDVRPVVFQLHGVVAKADDIGVCLVGIGYHGALHHAAAARVVISGHGVGCHAGKALHGGADGGIIPRVLIAAVEDHGRLHADIHGNCGAQVAARGGDGRAAGVFHVARDGEPVVRKRTGVRV